MTLDEVILLIQTWIVENGNEEITADVLRPILEAMVNQPNDLIGDLDNLTTTYQTDLVGAINEINSLISSSGLVIFTGTDLPDVHSFPTVLTPANFYVQLDGSTVLGMWVYNGNEWIAQVRQRTRTLKKFVSLIGVTVAGKTQTQWMAEAINLNIANGVVYECEPGDIIDFFVNIAGTGLSSSSESISVTKIYTRLCTGATSVTSVTANDLMPDEREDVAIEDELIIELGDIGTDTVWDAFNASPDQPFEMDNEMFVSAIQTGENKLWQWIGGTGTFGSTATLAVEGDFLDLTAQPVVTIGGIETIRAVATPPFEDIVINNDYYIYTATEVCTIISTCITVATAPTGADIEVILRKNGADVGSTNMVVVATATVSNEVTYTSQTLAIGDVVAIRATQIGSTIAGENILLKLTIQK